MSAEEKKAVIVRLIESLNRHDLSVLDEHPAMRSSRAFFEEQFRNVPDEQATIDLLLVDGEWVAGRLLVRGTRTGDLNGVAPAGQTIDVEVLAMWRIVDGKVVEQFSQGAPRTEVQPAEPAMAATA